MRSSPSGPSLIRSSLIGSVHHNRVVTDRGIAGRVMLTRSSLKSLLTLFLSPRLYSTLVLVYPPAITDKVITDKAITHKVITDKAIPDMDPVLVYPSASLSRTHRREERD